MGTTYSVKLGRLPNGLTQEQLQAQIDERLERVNDLMSTWREESEISRFNRAASSDWFSVDAETVKVAAAAKQIHSESGGAFDVTVGPLVNLWRFGPEKQPAELPADEAIAQTRLTVGDHLWHVRSDPPALRKQMDTLEIDFSAIAKGYGVDVVAELLGSLDVTDYMVEIGGEVRTRGKRDATGSAWRLAIETPVAGQRGIQTVVELHEAALATSGDYRNFFEVADQKFSHTIDPRTGRPVAHQLASVSVIADRCMEADAWATAIMVAGPEAGYNLAEEHDLAVLLIIRDGDQFTERASPSFEAYRAK